MRDQSRNRPSPGPEITIPRKWSEQIITQTGPRSKIRSVPKIMISLTGIVNHLVREFSEMLYLGVLAYNEVLRRRE